MKIAFCISKFARFSKIKVKNLFFYFQLGQFPIIEVMVVTIITTVASYPNPYTRMGATAMIDVLVQECGPIINSDLCDYKIKVYTFETCRNFLSKFYIIIYYVASVLLFQLRYCNDNIW